MKQFKVHDVVTIITNHYNNDDHSFYKEFDFAQIIDIKDNHYVLDLYGYSSIDNSDIQITASVETLQINKNVCRDFHGYLEVKGLIDTIGKLSIYTEALNKRIKKQEEIINEHLHTILKVFNQTHTKEGFETTLSISNMKDRLFHDFQDTIPLCEDLRSLKDIDLKVSYTAYDPSDYCNSLQNTVKEYNNYDNNKYENFKI